ncbi:Replicative DNA helicase [hydrothermal vent metagenome]|uniref:DNA 5'-3' helicase n=1 Tax=hydrothermal vent metagenome TaxID=652676 RepID=A0A1W1CQ05_9ZZZZ
MELENLKTAPHSIEAEQSVLGGLMLHNEQWDKVAEIITPKDFYTPNHKIIFDAIWILLEANEVIDIVIIKEYLQKNDNLDKIGGFEYLVAIAEMTPSISNIDGYAKHIRELSVLRELIKSSNEIADMAYHPKGESVDKLLDSAEKKIFDIAESVLRKKKDVVNAKEVLPQIMEKVQENQNSDGITGLSTGFDELDKLTSGLQKGDLIIIAGRPSMGKTAFAMNLVENVAIKEEKAVAVFSLEMSTEQLIMRMISSFGHINATKIRDGGMSDIDWASFNNAVKRIEESTVLIDETPSITPTEIRAKCRRLKRQHPNLSLIMVDYLQLMTVSGSNAENRVQEISEISRSLKALAKELNVPVIALSQLNRGVESRPKTKKGRMPQMADLRESGAIEQDADIIAFIYRDERYHGEDYQNPEEKGKADINIAKHRNGETKTIQLAFIGEYAKFDNLAAQGQFDEIHDDGVRETVLSDLSESPVENHFDNEVF